jgi:hypothetical protein
MGLLQMRVPLCRNLSTSFITHHGISVLFVISVRPEITGLVWCPLSRSVKKNEIWGRPKIAVAMCTCYPDSGSNDNSSLWWEEGELFWSSVAQAAQAEPGCKDRQQLTQKKLYLSTNYCGILVPKLKQAARQTTVDYKIVEYGYSCTENELSQNTI